MFIIDILHLHLFRQLQSVQFLDRIGHISVSLNPTPSVFTLLCTVSLTGMEICTLLFPGSSAIWTLLNFHQSEAAEDVKKKKEQSLLF